MFIGSRLKELRNKFKMTQEELGDKLNVTKVRVCCYENNVRTPSLETLDDMCNVFGVNSDYFLGKDLPVVMEDTEKYSIYISKEELEILKQLRLYKDLYQNLIKDPKRMCELIDKKLK